LFSFIVGSMGQLGYPLAKKLRYVKGTVIRNVLTSVITYVSLNSQWIPVHNSFNGGGGRAKEFVSHYADKMVREL